VEEAGDTNARNFFIISVVLLLVFSSIFTRIFNANVNIGIDAFAKKKSKTSSNIDSNISNGLGDGSGSSNKEQQTSSTTYNSDMNRAQATIQSTSNNINNKDKFVIINFDDSHQSDYTYAKPILDKYGFKATFFEVCDWVEEGYHDLDISITWQQIAALQQDGMDIEAHTMTHPNLNDLSSQSDLDYEIGQSKQCLENHGFNPTIFAYPNGKGSDDPTVVNIVAKYYDLARTDSKLSALTFLHCDGGDIDNMNNQQQQKQTDCRTHFSDGTLTPSNRYSINSWAHKHIEEGCSTNSADNGNTGTCARFRYKYDNTQMFEKFITAVNNQSNYNKDEIVRAIPIIVYHTLVNYPDLSDSNRPIDTTLNLFDAEMKYLYDNGFKVLTMSDLGYDDNSNYLYVKSDNR
jgi:peptidoglycan/xylan/chitin deacetylase (PgdA/CDA1 family)